MSNNINLIAFGTFGNPNGFRQSYFIGDSRLSSVIKTFDLNTNAITLFPNSKIYAIRKENTIGENSISYCVYSFAKEQNSERSGTFIGTSILFTEQIADEHLTLKVLNECQNSLYNRNVKDNVILVSHSDHLSITKPKDFDKLNQHLKEVEDINLLQSSNKPLVVYCNTDDKEFQNILKRSIELLNSYDTIYFTKSQDIAQYVHQKNIFNFVELAGFEAEIQKLVEVRKKIRATAIAEFEQTIQQLEADKTIEVNRFFEQIKSNELLHLENERLIKESKIELEQIKQIYGDYFVNISDLTNQLKSGKKIQEIKVLFNENKRIFIESIDQIKKPEFINTLKKPIPNARFKQVNPQSDFHQKNNPNPYINESYPRHHHRRIDKFKVMTLLLLLLWIGTLTYFLLQKSSATPTNNKTLPKQQINPNNDVENINHQQQPIKTNTVTLPSNTK